MIRPVEAWVLRRLVSGGTVNGELQALDGPFRCLGDRMSGLPLESRHDALEAFLEARNDRDSIVKAMATVNPQKPAPEPDDDDPDGDWPPLRIAALLPVEPFPVDILPEPVSRLVRDGAAAIGCPEDFLAVPVLALAGGAIGRSVSLFLKRGYFANSTIFAAEVGPLRMGRPPR
jgi:hypothetical protein